MLLTHWLTLFERDWQFALDFRTTRVTQTPCPWLYARGKQPNAAKKHLPPVPPRRAAKLPAHWKPRRRQCNST